MKKMMVTATLALAGFAAHGNEIVEAGRYVGTKSAVIFNRECRLEIYRDDEGMLNVAGVRDSGHAYNLWSRDGLDFKTNPQSGAKSYERSLRLSMVDAGGTRIYDSRTDKNDGRAYNDHGVLEVVTTAEGVPTEYTFRYTSSTERANVIQCKDLRAL